MTYATIVLTNTKMVENLFKYITNNAKCEFKNIYI